MSGNLVKDDPYGIKAEDVLELDEEARTKGEVQSGGCRDLIWAILFYCQLIALLVTFGIYGGNMLQEETINTPYLSVSFTCGGFAFLFCGLSIIVMIAGAELLIKLSLYFVLSMSWLFAVMGILSQEIIIFVTSAIFFLIGLCYMKAVRNHIPFATCNIETALAAIDSHFGVIFVAYFMAAVGFVWTIVWSITLIGVVQHICGDVVCDVEDYPYGYLLIMIVSYWWTLQVIINVVQVTVGGVVGSWWFSSSEDYFCCSEAVFRSFSRSVTTSLGSICLGSLMVAIIQSLYQLAYSAWHNNNNAILMCITECMLSCIGGLIDYFNKWAFIYVGVYGYSYCEASTKVMQLFRDRGWVVIVTDNLVGNTILLLSIITGIMTGTVGAICALSADWFDDDVERADIQAFFLGFIIGLMLSSIMFSVISSGVNTVVVCFADAPAEFKTNHPHFSKKLIKSWKSAFPNCFSSGK